MRKRVISLLLSVVMIFGLVCGIAPGVSAASSMTTSETCIELIKKLEGFSKYPYYDYGQWTVGYGTACPAEDQARYEANGITEAEADALMREYVADFETRLNAFIDSRSLTLNQSQFDALLSFTYNLGTNWMNNDSNFRTAVIKGYTGNDFIATISRWCTANGEVLPTLINRRLVEANLYLNGIYKTSPPDHYQYVIYDVNLEDAVTDVRVQGFDAKVTDRVRAEASKSGYVFQGWFTLPTGGTQVTKLDASVTVTTLYAHWKTESGEVVKPETDGDVIAVGVVTADKLNIRSGAGKSYDVVGALYEGDQVSITEFKTADGSEWGKISKGWICMDYVVLASDSEKPDETVPEETEPEETEPEATEPEATEPEATEPEATEPEATEPEATEPEETKPEEEKDKVIATGKIVNCTTLRIRSGAGTNHPQVGSLSRGTRVEIYETTSVNGNLWGRIDKGWICMTGYVQLDESAAPVGKTGVVTASSLNVRAGAGTNFAKVGSLSKGTRVEILETVTVGGATWGRIEQGWVHMSYIKLDSGSGSTSGGSSSGGTSGGSSSDSNSGGSSSGSSSGNTSGATGTVTGADWLRVRSGPGTNHSQVGSLARGTKVTVLELKTVDGTPWGRIDKGWICLSYVTMDEDAVIPGTVKTVTASSLNIRSGPGTGYEKVGSYSKGTQVKILETTKVGGTTWGKTDKGWISLDYVA